MPGAGPLLECNSLLRSPWTPPSEMPAPALPTRAGQGVGTRTWVLWGHCLSQPSAPLPWLPTPRCTPFCWGMPGIRLPAEAAQLPGDEVGLAGRTGQASPQSLLSQGDQGTKTNPRLSHLHLLHLNPEFLTGLSAPAQTLALIHCCC